VRAVLGARPIRRVLVYARDPDRRTGFARIMAEETGVEVVAVDSAEQAVRQADVICCVTTASEPVFDAAWVKPGTHVNGIGAFRAGMVELPPALFSRAALVAVDARDAALAEAGDVLAAIGAGAIAEGSLVEIGTIERDRVASRDPQAITVFKSVGLAIQDVAAAGLVVSRLLGRA
jgi:ornithine cyclodeaminase